MYNRFYPNYQQSNLEWIMVQSIDQVDSIAVQPNGKAWIMVQNEPIFGLRTADAMGLVTTELYRFERYERPQASYITVDQLREALAELKGELTHEPTSKPTGTSKRASDKTDA